MPVSYERRVRETVTVDEVSELRRVDQLARRLEAHLLDQSGEIDGVHIHGASSSRVQTIVAELLVTELEFGTEIVLTPEDGLVTRARPDFFYRLSPSRGVAFMSLAMDDLVELLRPQHLSPPEDRRVQDRVACSVEHGRTSAPSPLWSYPFG